MPEGFEFHGFDLRSLVGAAEHEPEKGGMIWNKSSTNWEVFLRLVLKLNHLFRRTFQLIRLQSTCTLVREVIRLLIHIFFASVNMNEPSLENSAFVEAQ